jgi:hypothetical protein
MYSIKLKAYFFESFKNSTAFFFSSIVILLSFILKITFIARRMPVFANYLKKRRLLSFQTRVYGKNDLSYFGAIIKNNERRSRNNSYFKSIYNKLLLRVPGKSKFFFIKEYISAAITAKFLTNTL